MLIPEGSYLFHIARKSPRSKDYYVYIAERKDWEENGIFPTASKEKDLDTIEEYLNDIGLVREEEGIYRSEVPLYEKDLVGLLTDNGFEEQSDFSSYVETSLQDREMYDDDEDMYGNRFNMDDYIEGNQDDDTYLNNI